VNKNDFIISEKSGIGLVQSELLLKHKLKHAFTNSKGGFSEGDCSTLNIAFHVGDKKEDVIKNRRKILEIMNLDIERLTVAEQTHSANIAVVDQKNIGKGSLSKEDEIKNTDALITNLENVPLAVMVADCVPIILFDPQRRVIAAVHAGWRGTVGKIVFRTITKMKDSFSCQPNNIIGAIGPCIGPCHYQVGEEVLNAVDKELPEDKEKIFSYTNQKYSLDLKLANILQMREAGMADANIEAADICTYCSDLFYSYRKAKGGTGRFWGIISLEEE